MVVDELAVGPLEEGEATDGVFVFDELVEGDVLTGVGDMVGVGFNVVVLTGVGLLFATDPSVLVQAEASPVGEAITQIVSVTMSVV